MLYCDRIDLSEGTDIAKINISKECMVCHYWLLDRAFKFQEFVCNGSHDFTMMCLNLSDIAIITAIIAIISLTQFNC